MQSSSHWRAFPAASCAGASYDGVVGQIGEEVLKNHASPIGQFLVGGRHRTEIFRDPASRHHPAQLVDQFNRASRLRDNLPGRIRDKSGDRPHILPPHHAAHVRHVAFVLGRVLHAKEEILAARDHPHFRSVCHVKNVVARQHFLNILKARHQHDTLDGADRLHPAQHGEQGLRILHELRLQVVHELHGVALRIGQDVVHGRPACGFRLVQSAFQIVE